MTTINNTWIQTFTGKKFFPLEPRIEDIDILDIAHALSNQCRFSGHCRHFYSVAQHSVLVSLNVPVEFALWGLLHDASEAYLLDVPRPLKQHPAFAFYREAENKLERLIAQRFNLSWPMPELVKLADMLLLDSEAQNLMAPLHPDWPIPTQVLPDRIHYTLPHEAEKEFLARFRKLTIEELF